MIDGNKTALTHRVTATAAQYLDRLGCKPIETEVPISDDWIADLGSYWYPTWTEGRKLWGDRRSAFLGLAAGFPMTVVVEVKTTRSDFLRDKKWRPQPRRDWPANICFLAFPTGILSHAELPAGWFGLETTADGNRLRRVHRCYDFHPETAFATATLIAAVGIRRDHRTRGAAMRAWLKARRADEGAARVRYRAARLLEGLCEWLQGKGCWPDQSLRDLLPLLGVKTLPDYCDEVITFFEKLRTRTHKNPDT